MPARGAAVSVRRKRKPSEFHSEVTRERIRAGVIIDRFQKHFMGELELTPTQIRVGEILLRKVIPDLTHTDLSTRPVPTASAPCRFCSTIRTGRKMS
jgi:hypothetical protein